MSHIGFVGLICAIEALCAAGVTFQARAPSSRTVVKTVDTSSRSMPSSPSACTTMVDVQCEGGDLAVGSGKWKKSQYAANADDCAAICTERRACRAFTYLSGSEGTQGDVEGDDARCVLKFRCPETARKIDTKATSGICLKTRQVCEVWGDPHYMTFDNTKFRFQASGTFNLANSAADELVVQGFNCPFAKNNKASFLVGVAISAGAHHITIVGNTLKVDGVTKPLSGLSLTIDDITLTQCAKGGWDGVCVVMPSGAEVHTSDLKCTECTPTKFAIAAVIALPDNSADSATGICKGCFDVREVSQTDNLFGPSDLSALTELCGTQMPAPYPNAEQACADEGVSIDDANSACQTLLQGKTDAGKLLAQYFYTECTYDYCVTGGSTDTLQADVAAEDLAEEYSDAPGSTPSSMLSLLSLDNDAGVCTMAPTPSPTPPPYDPSASGDPHLINIRGERFNIMKTGQMEFLRVPYESASETANLTVSATIEDMSGEGGGCSALTRIASLRFGSAWLGERVLDVTMDERHDVLSAMFDGVKINQSFDFANIGGSLRVGGGVLRMHMPDESHLSIGFATSETTLLNLGQGTTWIDVSHEGQFLNMRARSLKNLDGRIGGLLGEDDHTAASAPASGCPLQALVMSAPSDKHSFAFAM